MSYKRTRHCKIKITFKQILVYALWLSLESKRPDKILKIVKKIRDLNKQNQIRKRLKILTPDQMLSRLPITLAQLNAANSSEKFKNEIRQLSYSLYRSKELTKQIYKSFIDII